MEQNSSLKKIIWFTILLLLITGAILGLFYKDIISFLNRRQASPIVKEKNTEVPSSIVLATLESRVSFPKKEVLESKSSNVVELGNIFSGLIITESTSQKINKEFYKDGSEGWLLTYKVEDDVKNVYNLLYSIAAKSGYKINFSSRSTNATIIVAETTNNIIKITTRLIGENNTEVLINIVEKGA